MTIPKLNITVKKYKPLKIIFFNENFGGNFFSYRSLADAMEALGHKVLFWHQQVESPTPPLDMAALHPEIDVFMGVSYNTPPALLRAFEVWRRNPNFKIVLYGSSCGDEVDTYEERYQVVKRKEDERRIIDKLRPSLIYLHHSVKDSAVTLQGWRRDGHQITGIQNCYNYVANSNPREDDFFKADISYVGGYWPLKSKPLDGGLDAYILPLCHPKAGLRVKIFGQSAWPTSCWLGPAREEDVATILNSATVCPNMSESHSRRWGRDTVTRPFTVCGVGGGLCVSDEVKGLRDALPELPMAPDAGTYHDMIFHYLKEENQGERKLLVEKLQRRVLNNHTNFHRVKHLFKVLGLSNYDFTIKVDNA